MLITRRSRVQIPPPLLRKGRTATARSVATVNRRPAVQRRYGDPVALDWPEAMFGGEGAIGWAASLLAELSSPSAIPPEDSPGAELT